MPKILNGQIQNPRQGSERAANHEQQGSGHAEDRDSPKKEEHGGVAVLYEAFQHSRCLIPQNDQAAGFRQASQNQIQLMASNIAAPAAGLYVVPWANS